MNTAPIHEKLQKTWQWLTVFLLAAFLCCGVLIFRDYGASADEINQIEAGHITWTAICEQFGKEAENFRNLPKLKDYYNRYYGQAATFPTVIAEALQGFRMDSGTVLRLRHIWNFLLYFAGIVSFAILVKLRFQRNDVVFFAVLFHILTPRLFGDAFYNDRDSLLIALLWIALLCFAFFQRRPGILSALICAFFFALAINTRFFALVLIFLPVGYCLRKQRGNPVPAAVLLVMTVVFWYIMTPVFWGSFLSQAAAAFRIFASGQQRTQETLGMAEVPFFGKYYRENDLPFWYLPLWIFISTPLVPQLFSAYGLFRSFREKTDHLTDRFMQLFLCPGITAVMLIRPVLYNGWRHMYFFHVPIFWFAAFGLSRICASKRKWVYGGMLGVILLSSGWTVFRIRSLHPYEYIYLNPLFQNRTGDFETDYWRLSTTEGLRWIWSKEQDEFRIGELNANLDNAIIGLFPVQRERIYVSNYTTLHRFPPDYLIFNYSGSQETEKSYPLFDSVYIVERDGVKLAEVFKRRPKIMPEITAMEPDFPEALDGVIDLEAEWRSEGPQNTKDEIIIQFAEPIVLSGISLLPGDDEHEYARSPEVSISDDGLSWTVLPAETGGLFDLVFPAASARFLRIRNTAPADVRWSFREIYFYQ